MAEQRLLDRVDITALSPDDLPYIHDTWAKTFRVKNRDASAMPLTAYSPWHRAHRERLLKDGLVLVARGKARPLWIAGYGVFGRVGDDFVAHWVCSRGGCKNQGLASRLLLVALERIGRGAQRMVFTHSTENFAAKAQSMGFVFVDLEELYAGRAA